MSSTSFPPGSQVEVRSDDAGFRGAWFEATVLKYSGKHRRYTVTYDSLVTEDVPPKPIWETVYYPYVRPRPPGGSRSFKLHQLVEAYHNDAWWKGVVTEVPREEDGLYTVRFPLSNEVFEFQGEMIREQVEWVKGIWVPVQDEDDQEGDIMFGVGSEVEVSRDKENYGAAWFVGIILKVIGKSYFLVEYKTLRVDDGSNRMLLKEIVDVGYIRPSPPPAPKFEGFNVLDEVEAFHKDGWLVGVVTRILPGSRYVVKSEHQDEEIELDQIFLRPHFDWTNMHWVPITQEIKVKRGRGRPKKEVVDSAAKKKIKIVAEGKEEAEDRSLKGERRGRERPKKQSTEFSTARECEAKITVEKEKENQCSNVRGRGRPKKQRADPFAEKESETAQEKEKQGLDKAREGRGKPKKQTLTDSSTTTPKEETVVSQDKDGNVTVSRGKKSAGRKMKTHAVERSNRPLSVPTYDTDGEVAGEYNVNLEVNKSEGCRVEDEVETSQPCRKLKKGRLLETKSAPRRTKRISQPEKLSSPVTIPTSSISDDEVADKSGLMNLKKKKVKEPHVEGTTNLSQPHKKSKKGIPQEEDIQIINSTLKDHAPKTPKMVENISFAAMPMSEGGPTLVNKQNHTCRIYPSGKAGTKSHTFPLLTICNEQDMTGANGYGEHANSGEVSSRVLGDRSEPQLKAANIGHSPVAADFLSVAHLGNCEVSPHNTRMRRKNLVIRGPYKKTKNSDVVDMKQLTREETEEHCRSNVSDNIFEMVSTSIGLSPQEDSFRDYKKFTPNSLLSEAPTDPTTSRTDQAVGALVDPSPREDVHDPNKFILSTLPSEEAPTDPTPSETEKVVPEIDKTPSDPAPSGSSPSEKYICDNDELILNAFPAKKAIARNNVGMVGSLVYPSPKEDVDNGKNKFFLGMLPSVEAPNDPTPSTTEMVVSEVHTTPSDLAPSGSPPSGKHACDHEFVPSTCVRQKAGGNIVEMVSASVNPSPSDDFVHDQNKFISSLLPSEDPPDPTRSITEKVVSEIDMILSDPAPTELSPSEKHVFDHNALVPGVCPKHKAINETDMVQTDMVPSGPLSNKITLPFTKGSAIWKIIESMEVFHTMPQQPHFHELNNHNVELREGMAIGFMLTFANLIDDIKKLQIDDSQDVIERKIEALAPLELNGFNVQVLRSLLEKLLVIKCNASQSAAKQVFLEGQIVETENKVHELDQSIIEQNKVIWELQENLQRCQVGRSCTLSEKSIKESEVSQLKTDLKDSTETYLLSEMQFNTTINDPW